MRTLLKKRDFAPNVVTTDKLRSYAALSDLGLSARHDQGLGKNNRAEVSNQPNRQRERKMQRFKSHGSTQLFLSTHSAVYSNFNNRRHLTFRQALRIDRVEAMMRRRSAVLVA